MYSQGGKKNVIDHSQNTNIFKCLFNETLSHKVRIFLLYIALRNVFRELMLFPF